MMGIRALKRSSRCSINLTRMPGITPAAQTWALLAEWKNGDWKDNQRDLDTDSRKPRDFLAETWIDNRGHCGRKRSAQSSLQLLRHLRLRKTVPFHSGAETPLPVVLSPLWSICHKKSRALFFLMCFESEASWLRKKQTTVTSAGPTDCATSTAGMPGGGKPLPLQARTASSLR